MPEKVSQATGSVYCDRSHLLHRCIVCFTSTCDGAPGGGDVGGPPGQLVEAGAVVVITLVVVGGRDVGGSVENEGECDGVGEKNEDGAGGVGELKE
mmetsp:Transcript_43420/g.114374  ORF Transcript_43420/g.114374 Transcript_43420/m.114374 type:complete len:96 (+) Transcript_43420:1840-2127(+)